MNVLHSFSNSYCKYTAAHLMKDIHGLRFCRFVLVKLSVTRYMSFIYHYRLGLLHYPVQYITLVAIFVYVLEKHILLLVVENLFKARVLNSFALWKERLKLITKKSSSETRWEFVPNHYWIWTNLDPNLCCKKLAIQSWDGHQLK